MPRGNRGHAGDAICEVTDTVVLRYLWLVREDSIQVPGSSHTKFLLVFAELAMYSGVRGTLPLRDAGMTSAWAPSLFAI